MKRSVSVPATFLIATAATLIAAGCAPSSVAQEQRRCVDAQGKWIEDRNCDATGTHRSSGAYWLYGGTAAALGSRVAGGSRTINPNAHVTDSADRTIQRGGFNNSGRSGSSLS